MKNYLILFLASVILLFSNIWGQPLYILDEAKNAACAREMLESSSPVVPTFNYTLRTDKPPLHYYFMMLAYSIFGVNEFAARFFSSVFGILTVLVTYAFSRRYLTDRAALWSAVVLLSSLHFNLQFHFSVPDPYLIFFLTLAFFSFFGAIKDAQPMLFYVFYAALALGTLSKGPVAVALPGLILLIFLIWKKDLTLKQIFKMRLISGGLLFLFIAVPWYVMVGLETNFEWTNSFFFKHNVGRFTKTMEGHGGIFLITPIFAFVGLLPFSVFFVQAIRKSWQERQNDLLLFSLIVSAVFIGFFSVSQTKLPNYIVPSYPFLAIILGHFLASLKIGKTGDAQKLGVSYGGYLFLMLFVPAAAYFALPFEKALSDLQYLAAFFLLLPFGAGLAFYFYAKNNSPMANRTIAGSFMLTTLLFFYFVFPRIYMENPVIGSLPKMDVEKPIAYYKRLNPSFAFYLRRPILKLETVVAVRRYLAEHPEAYIITSRKKFREIADIADFEILVERKDTFERPVTVVVTPKR